MAGEDWESFAEDMPKSQSLNQNFSAGENLKSAERTWCEEVAVVDTRYLCCSRSMLLIEKVITTHPPRFRHFRPNTTHDYTSFPSLSFASPKLIKEGTKSTSNRRGNVATDQHRPKASHEPYRPLSLIHAIADSYCHYLRTYPPSI